MTRARSACSVARGVRVDVHEVSERARWVLDPRVPVDDLTVPTARLRGDLQSGWYDDWVLLERERLRQLRLPSPEAWRSSSWPQRDATARHWRPPMQSCVRSRCARVPTARLSAHLVEGNVADAPRGCELFRAGLIEELGVGPSEEMVRLVHGAGSRRRVSHMRR
jgi:hypothetical protein